MQTKISKYICKCGKGMKSMLTYKDKNLSFYCECCGRAVVVVPKEIWFEHQHIEKDGKKDWEVTSSCK